MARNAVIYARFSPRPDAETSESIENQIDACREFCESKRWTVKSVHYDKAVSGNRESQEERPGLWDAMRDLLPGDVLVVYKLDRLARSVFLSHSIDRMAYMAGAEIVSVQNEGTWSDSPEDQMLRNILITFDEYFREANARRTSDAMKSQMKQGKIMTDPKRLPFGWELTTRGDKMRPCKEEQAIIDQIREMAEGGKTAGQIANKLNAAELYPRTGKWDRNRIFRVIRSNRIAYACNPNLKILRPRYKGSRAK